MAASAPKWVDVARKLLTRTNELMQPMKTLGLTEAWSTRVLEAQQCLSRYTPLPCCLCLCLCLPLSRLFSPCLYVTFLSHQNVFFSFLLSCLLSVTPRFDTPPRCSSHDGVHLARNHTRLQRIDVLKLYEKKNFFFHRSAHLVVFTTHPSALQCVGWYLAVVICCGLFVFLQRDDFFFF